MSTGAINEIANEPVDGPEETPARQSVRDRIRAQRDELIQNDSLDLIVPGYADLGVRYRALPDREIEAFSKKVNKSKAGIRAGCDLLAASCVCILVREQEGGKLEPLVDDEEVPVRFDEEFARFMGIEATRVRDIILQTFSVGGQTLAHMEHAVALQQWMGGKLEAIDPELLGE